MHIWDERQAYEELLYWDSLIQDGHRLLPHDFDRYEDLRYWYDCLCYEEELRNYHDYMAAMEQEAQVPRAPLRPYDRHLMSKHSLVYPTPDELEAVQTIISHVECALKTISDMLDEEAKETSQAAESTEPKLPVGVLRGVMRVGLVAKGLLLKGDTDLELVLLCACKPTVALLKRVAEMLTAQIPVVTEDKYEVIEKPEDAAVVVRSTKEKPLTLTIHLTSPLVRKLVEKEGEGMQLGPGSPNQPPVITSLPRPALPGWQAVLQQIYLIMCVLLLKQALCYATDMHMCSVSANFNSVIQ